MPLDPVRVQCVDVLYGVRTTLLVGIDIGTDQKTARRKNSHSNILDVCETPFTLDQIKSRVMQ